MWTLKHTQFYLLFIKTKIYILLLFKRIACALQKKPTNTLYKHCLNHHQREQKSFQSRSSWLILFTRFFFLFIRTVWILTHIGHRTVQEKIVLKTICHKTIFTRTQHWLFASKPEDQFSVWRTSRIRFWLFNIIDEGYIKYARLWACNP